MNLQNIYDMIEKLIAEIEQYSGKYQFSFQFWGPGNNNVYVFKDDVELYSSGDYDTVEEALVITLNYIYRINLRPIKVVRVCSYCRRQTVPVYDEELGVHICSVCHAYWKIDHEIISV